MSLVRAGFVVDYTVLLKKIKDIHKIKKIFTIITIGHNNTRKTISSFRIIKETKTVKILLPRFGGFMLQNSKLVSGIKNLLQPGKSIQIPKCTMKPTDNQSTVLKYLLMNIYTKKNIEKGTSSTILQMKAGYGKTYLAIGLMQLMKKKTMIIVPNEYLLKQWVAIIEESFPKNTVGKYYSKSKKDGDFIVAIINSALKYPDYRNIGLVIYDEVHMYCSPKLAKIFSIAQSQLCLGITATPNHRLDKFDPVAQWALGKVIYADRIKGWNNLAVVFQTEVTRVIYNGHTDYTKIIESEAGIVSVPLMINQLIHDPYRNQIIIKYAVKLYNLGRNVFVFSDRREHLHVLAKTLQNLKIEYEAPELINETKKDDDAIIDDATIDDETKIKLAVTGVTELMGGSTDEDIERAKQTGRIVMTTFQYSGTGVSINKMNSLIMATPRKSNMEQILGRIYRLTSDATVKRYIIDITDNRTCLKSQYYSRKKTYLTHLQAEINDIKISWDESDS